MMRWKRNQCIRNQPVMISFNLEKTHFVNKGGNWASGGWNNLPKIFHPGICETDVGTWVDLNPIVLSDMVSFSLDCKFSWNLDFFFLNKVHMSLGRSSYLMGTAGQTEVTCSFWAMASLLKRVQESGKIESKQRYRLTGWKEKRKHL